MGATPPSSAPCESPLQQRTYSGLRAQWWEGREHVVVITLITNQTVCRRRGKPRHTQVAVCRGLRVQQRLINSAGCTPPGARASGLRARLHTHGQLRLGQLVGDDADQPRLDVVIGSKHRVVGGLLARGLLEGRRQVACRTDDGVAGVLCAGVGIELVAWTAHARRTPPPCTSRTSCHYCHS